MLIYSAQLMLDTLAGVQSVKDFEFESRNLTKQSTDVARISHG